MNDWQGLFLIALDKPALCENLYNHIVEQILEKAIRNFRINEQYGNLEQTHIKLFLFRNPGLPAYLRSSTGNPVDMVVTMIFSICGCRSGCFSDYIAPNFL